MSALPWHNGDVKWREALAGRKNESVDHIGDVRRSVPRRSGHVWDCHVCLVPPLIICLSGSQNSVPVLTQTIPLPAITTYLC